MKYAKHIHVLELLATSHTRDEAFDHMFTYIHANWAEPSSFTDTEFKGNVFDCSEMLVMPREVFEAKLEALPPYFSEVLFPIAVARYMLRELALPFYPMESNTFGEFYRRYGGIILST